MYKIKKMEISERLEALNDCLVGLVLKHYYEGYYIKILGVSVSSETLEYLISYKHTDDDIIWTRPLTALINPTSENCFEFTKVDGSLVELPENYI